MKVQAKIISLADRPKVDAAAASAIDAAWLQGFMSVVAMDEYEVVAHLRVHWDREVTLDQLRNWRKRNKGPAVLSVGRAVIYTKRDVDLWAEFGTSRPAPTPPSPK